MNQAKEILDTKGTSIFFLFKSNPNKKSLKSLFYCPSIVKPMSNGSDISCQSDNKNGQFSHFIIWTSEWLSVDWKHLFYFILFSIFCSKEKVLKFVKLSIWSMYNNILFIRFKPTKITWDSFGYEDNIRWKNYFDHHSICDL